MSTGTASTRSVLGRMVEVSGEHDAPVALYPKKKEPQCPLNRKICGPKSQFGRSEEKKNLFSLPGFESRIFWSLDRLHSPGSVLLLIRTVIVAIKKKSKYRRGVFGCYSNRCWLSVFKDSSVLKIPR